MGYVPADRARMTRSVKLGLAAYRTLSVTQIDDRAIIDSSRAAAHSQNPSVVYLFTTLADRDRVCTNLDNDLAVGT